jgi:hypothetical protein
MCRESRNSPSLWLFAAAILIALTAGDAISAGRAFACSRGTESTHDSTGAGDAPALAVVCPGRGNRNWSVKLIELSKGRSSLEAKQFAERIKRHLGRQFATRKQQFERHKAQVERQRRANSRSKVRNKARQFAAARRHAARHAHRNSRAIAARFNGVPAKKLRNRERAALPANGSSGRHAPHWRSLWRHGAHNAAQTPSD